MNKFKSLIFILTIAFLADANSSFAQTLCEELQCRDYKGRVIDNSICSSHVSVIGDAPSTKPCPPGCGSTACASPPNCDPGMTSIITGQDSNNCNTYLCVSETCAPKPACASGTAEYEGPDGNNCPMWLCTSNNNCPGVTPPNNCGAIGYTDFLSGGCTKYRCNSCEEGVKSCPAGETRYSRGRNSSSGCNVMACKKKTTRCYEGPTSCPAGMRRITGIKNPSTGCWVRECLPPCPTPTCPAGQFVKMKQTNGGYKNGYCRNWSCSKTKPATPKPGGPTTTPITPKPGGPITTPTTPKPTGPTTSCPAKPSCGSGKTLKNNGKNAIGCTKWTCVAKSCPSKPTCSGGKTLKSTGKDTNGCTTYQCVSN